MPRSPSHRKGPQSPSSSSLILQNPLIQLVQPLSSRIVDLAVFHERNNVLDYLTHRRKIRRHRIADHLAAVIGGGQVVAGTRVVGRLLLIAGHCRGDVQGRVDEHIRRIGECAAASAVGEIVVLVLEQQARRVQIIQQHRGLVGLPIRWRIVILGFGGFLRFAVQESVTGWSTRRWADRVLGDVQALWHLRGTNAFQVLPEARQSD